MVSTTDLLMIGVILSIVLLAVLVFLITRNKQKMKLGLDTLPEANKEQATATNTESKETLNQTNMSSPSIYSSVTRDDVQKAE